MQLSQRQIQEQPLTTLHAISQSVPVVLPALTEAQPIPVTPLWNTPKNTKMDSNKGKHLFC